MDTKKGSALEKPLQLKINERSYETAVLTSKKGATWWAIVDDDGKASGREIEPLSKELPTSMNLEGTTFEFTTVTLSGPDGNTKAKPFHKTRMVQAKLEIRDTTISFNCRITKRRNGK